MHKIYPAARCGKERIDKFLSYRSGFRSATGIEMNFDQNTVDVGVAGSLYPFDVTISNDTSTPLMNLTMASAGVVTTSTSDSTGSLRVRINGVVRQIPFF